MKVKQVKLIYFSPTGTTQKVLESIAEGIAVESERTSGFWDRCVESDYLKNSHSLKRA